MDKRRGQVKPTKSKEKRRERRGQGGRERLVGG